MGAKLARQEDSLPRRQKSDDGLSVAPIQSVFSQLCSANIVQHWVVKNTRHKVTLVIEGDLLLAARRVARDRRISVNQMMRECLAALVEEANRKRLARARLRNTFETGLVLLGHWKWSRDELYER